MSTKRILYVSYDGMTDPLGQSQVLPYLVKLSEHGYQFTLLSFEKKTRYQKDGKIIQDICTAAGITWQPLFFTKNPPILSKIYDRWQMKRKVKQLHRELSFDMIHCRSYIAAEMGLSLKKATGVKFLFDMRGFWADEKVDAGQWNQQSFFFRKVYRHYKEKEKDFLLQADAIISLTQAAKDELFRQDAYKQLVIDVIPCCADLEHFNYNNISTEEKVKLRQQLKIPENKKVITYLGSVGGWYMTMEMFGFVGCLLRQYPEFVMLVLTKDEPGWVKSEAMQQGIPEDKLVITTAPREQMPLYISLSDCSIFFIRPTYSKKASSPTKHAELMGMGIPVICNDIGDTGHIIEQTKTGVVIQEFAENEYEKQIMKMNEILNIPKEYIRQTAFQYFDLKTGVASYLRVYKRILTA
ncbi:MAG: glycosyltransferase [Chitinophagaceae bacterium]